MIFVSFLQPENTVENQTTKPKTDGCVLRDLHHVQSASGEHTCLPGGVNALSRKFNENFSMESDSADETIQSIKQADIDGKHSRLTDCDMTSEEPTCIQCVFNTEACAQSNESATCSAEEAIQSVEQADIDGKHSEGLTDCDRTSEEPTCIQYSDDIDDDPFKLPPPLSPLDVQLLEDSVQKDELGRLKVLFVTDVISFLL